MKKYNTIDDLHAYIERAAKRVIKYYYTDFKNYDRPDIMKATGNKEKECYLILRESGSYFYTVKQLLDIDHEFPAVVMDYYTTDKTAQYYKIDFSRLTVEKIPAGLPKEIKARREWMEREKIEQSIYKTA